MSVLGNSNRPASTSAERDDGAFGEHAWLLQPGYWAVRTYRFGRWTMVAPRLVRPIVHGLYFAAYSTVRLATGIDIPRSAQIGPNLMIHHFGGIIIHPQAVIGRDCVLRHGVTIGERTEGGAVPVIGDRVNIGAYAQILGGVHVGDGARVGALSLVIADVPGNSTVVGIPAKVVAKS